MNVFAAAKMCSGRAHFDESIQNKVNDDNTQNLCSYLGFYRCGIIWLSCKDGCFVYCYVRGVAFATL